MRIKPDSYKKKEVTIEDLLPTLSNPDLRLLGDSVDFYSVMTYDYPTREIGANSPLTWMKQTAEFITGNDPALFPKILLGLNFYGYKYTSKSQDAVLCHDMINFIEEPGVEVIWDSNSSEHYLMAGKDMEAKFMFYPTLKSIDMRLKLAEELKTGGVAIWELGQGCEYFYNLL